TLRRSPRWASAAPTGGRFSASAVLPLRRATDGPGAGQEPLAARGDARPAGAHLPGMPGVVRLDRRARALRQVPQRTLAPAEGPGGGGAPGPGGGGGAGAGAGGGGRGPAPAWAQAGAPTPGARAQGAKTPPPADAPRPDEASGPFAPLPGGP